MDIKLNHFPFLLSSFSINSIHLLEHIVHVRVVPTEIVSALQQNNLIISRFQPIAHLLPILLEHRHGDRQCLRTHLIESHVDVGLPLV